MKVFGIDFTSQPSRRKPLTCAVSEVSDDALTFERLERWRSFDELETLLASSGPWIAGLDFPFGQADRFIETIGWPRAWRDYVAHAAKLDRKDFRAALDAYRSGRDAGDKEHRRRFDRLAGAISPQKLYGVPVGLMFYEGARRLAASDVTIPNLMAGDPSKIVLEAYPGIAARNLVGRASYKNDQATKQTADQFQTRLRIFRSLTGEQGRGLYGFKIHAPVDLCEDPGADDLDALLCAVQAAWGWRNLAACRETVGTSEEGWIADPALFRDAEVEARASRGDKRPG